MIGERDRARIVELGKRYRASKVLLFGSSVASDRERQDIDLAVEDVSPSLFFEFHGQLICSLSKPVDLVDLGEKSRFTDLLHSFYARDSATGTLAFAA
jgi:predicted nucleotidyltransferase